MQVLLANLFIGEHINVTKSQRVTKDLPKQYIQRNNDRETLLSLSVNGHLSKLHSGHSLAPDAENLSQYNTQMQNTAAGLSKQLFIKKPIRHNQVVITVVSTLTDNLKQFGISFQYEL